MSQKDSKHSRFEVDKIYFSLHLIKAMIPIKFKCRFFVQIKTFSTSSNIKVLAKSKDHYRTLSNLITFDNEILQFDAYLVFDNQVSNYKKKQIQIIVNLISDNRGDEIKLVGRFKIDLAQFMIQNMGKTVHKEQQLENCSVKQPEGAKIQYQLKLIKQTKVNMKNQLSKQVIFAQIQKSIFQDSLQYNAFCRQIFGNDHANGSILNSSVNNKSSHKLISQNGRGRQFVKQQSKQKKKPQKSSSIQKAKQTSNKEIKSQNEIQKQVNKLHFREIEKVEKQVQQKKILFSKIHKMQDHQNDSKKAQSKKEFNLEQSKIEEHKQFKMFQNQKSTIKQNDNKPHLKNKEQAQINENYLTQEMFQQQQIVIQSMQQQLQQANQIIEQYKLELDLMKEQAQRLQLQREAHLLEQEIHNRQKKKEGIVQQEKLANENKKVEEERKRHNGESNQLNKQIQNLNEEVNKYQQVVLQKEEIIEQKNKIIYRLEVSLQNLNILIQEKITEKDQLISTLTHDLENSATSYAQLDKKIIQKQEENLNLSNLIDELKVQVQSLEKSVNLSNINQLQTKLTEKQNKIKELETHFDLQKSIVAQNQLKIDDLQKKIIVYQEKISNLSKQMNKKDEKVLKYQALRQKAEQQMNKAIQKSKIIQKQKYFLTQQINTLNLQNKNVSKLVQEKVESYKNQILEMQEAYEESQNKIAELKFAVQSYQTTLQEEEEKNMKQVEQLTKKLQTFNKKQHLLRQSLDLLQNQTNKIRKYVQQKQKNIKQTEQLLISKQDQLVQKTDKLNYMQRKYRMSENAVEQLKIEIKILKAMTPMRDDQQNQNEQNEQDLQTRIFILNETNSQLLQKSKGQAQEIDQKQKKINQLERKLMSIDPLRREMKLFEQKNSLLENKCTDLREECKRITKNEIQIKSKLKQQVQQLEHAYFQCQKFQDEIKALQQQKFVLFAQNSEKELQINRLSAFQSRLKEQIKQFLKQKQEVEKMLIMHEQNQNALILKINELQVGRLRGQQNSKKGQQTRKYEEKDQKREISGIRLPKLSQIKMKKQDQELFSNQKQENKRKVLRVPSQRSREQEEVYTLKEQLQGYKQREEEYMCNVLDLQMQLDKIKEEKLSLSTSMNEQRISMKRNKSINVMSQPEKKQLKVACDQLQKLIEERLKNRQTQSLLQIVISNSQLLGSSQSRITTEQGFWISNQRNSLQQKSRILSRQVQKIKSLILKKNEISYKDKSQIIQFLKPCQNITNQLIKIIETVTKQTEDPFEEQA